MSAKYGSKGKVKQMWIPSDLRRHVIHALASGFEYQYLQNRILLGVSTKLSEFLHTYHTFINARGTTSPGTLLSQFIQYTTTNNASVQNT